MGVHTSFTVVLWQSASHRQIKLAADQAPVAHSVNRQPRGAPERAVLAAAAHQRSMRSA